MDKSTLSLIKNKLKDKRSNRVMFVSHCILNENTRYFGGAFRRASIHEVLIKLHEQDVGIVQMKCPEQIAWGGVQKRFMWMALGAKNGLLYKFRALVLPLFIQFTRHVYRRLAREVLHDINDYHNAGYEVFGLIGVDGSPSCGILRRLRMDCALEILTALKMDTLNSTDLNEHLYAQCLEQGYGIFIDELKRQLDKKNMGMRFYSVDIVKEMRGEKQEISVCDCSIK